MCWHRAFWLAGLIAALNIGTLDAAKPAREKGSLRTWTVTAGKYAGTYNGELVGVKDGVVAITVKEKQTVPYVSYQQSVTNRNVGGFVVRRYATSKAVSSTRTEDYAETIRFPFKLLSKKDRQWVEQDNASNCALSKKSAVGDIGVFATKDGSFYVDKKIDAKTAVISLVVDAETKWNFVLKSPLVDAMKEDPTHAGKGDDSLGQKNKLDFVLKGKKTFDEVYLPVFTEAD